MSKLNILMFSFVDKWQDWEEFGFVHRSSITAKALSDHPLVNKLIFVNAPTSIWQVAKKAIYSRGRLTYGVTVDEISEKLTVINQVRFAPRERLRPVAFNCNSFLHDRKLIKFLDTFMKETGFDNPVMWLGGPLFKSFVGKLNESLVVYDAYDDWIAHDRFDLMHPIILENYKTIQEQADIVFAVSRRLCEIFNRVREIAVWVPNGVDIDRFASPSGIDPIDMNGIRRPIFGYVGALQDRVDIKVTEALASAMPEASIVFVGPIMSLDHFKGLDQMNNIYFLGNKHPDDIASYIKSFDVCIMPHVENELTRSMDPLKLYEYLAAGKPVVASKLPGLEHLSDVVRFAASEKEYIESVRSALKDVSEEAVRKRLAFAAECSWDHRIDDMVAIMLKKRAEKIGQP